MIDLEAVRKWLDSYMVCVPPEIEEAYGHVQSLLSEVSRLNEEVAELGALHEVSKSLSFCVESWKQTKDKVAVERDTLIAEAMRLREALSKIVNDSSTHVVPNNGNDYADLCLACRARDDGTGRPSDLHRPNCVIREARRLLSTPSAEIERSMTQNAALETKAANAFALSECLRTAVTILASEAVGLREAALQAATLFDGMVLNGKLDQHECRNTFQRLKKALSSAPATSNWSAAFKALVKEHQERRIEQFYRPLSSEMLRHKELYAAAESALAALKKGE